MMIEIKIIENKTLLATWVRNEPSNSPLKLLCRDKKLFNHPERLNIINKKLIASYPIDSHIESRKRAYICVKNLLKENKKF